MHRFRTPFVRRIVVASLAAAALGTPVVVELASHASSHPTNNRAVAMPDCTYNWAPICDRW